MFANKIETSQPDCVGWGNKCWITAKTRCHFWLLTHDSLNTTKKSGNKTKNRYHESPRALRRWRQVLQVDFRVWVVWGWCGFGLGLSVVWVEILVPIVHGQTSLFVCQMWTCCGINSSLEQCCPTKWNQCRRSCLPLSLFVFLVPETLFRFFLCDFFSRFFYYVVPSSDEDE